MTPQDFIEALRQALIDVLVPEIRELKTEMQELRQEMNQRFARMDERFARMDGKLDVLIERDRRFDEVLKVSARLDIVEQKLEKLIAA